MSEDGLLSSQGRGGGRQLEVRRVGRKRRVHRGWVWIEREADYILLSKFDKCTDHALTEARLEMVRPRQQAASVGMEVEESSSRRRCPRRFLSLVVLTEAARMGY
jgi:hypothetical protein